MLHVVRIILDTAPGKQEADKETKRDGHPGVFGSPATVQLVREGHPGKDHYEGGYHRDVENNRYRGAREDDHGGGRGSWRVWEGTRICKKIVGNSVS